MYGPITDQKCVITSHEASQRGGVTGHGGWVVQNGLFCHVMQPTGYPGMEIPC